MNRFHQTPPIIEEYVKNPKLAPIVVLIDQAYKKTHWLSFFDDEYMKQYMKYLKSDSDELSQPDVKPGVWYYTGLITNLGNDKTLDYRHQVSYQYYPNIIPNEICDFIINESTKTNIIEMSNTDTIKCITWEYFDMLYKYNILNKEYIEMSKKISIIFYKKRFLVMILSQHLRHLPF